MLRTIKNIFKPEKIVLSDGQEIQPPKSIVPYIIIGLVLSGVITVIDKKTKFDGFNLFAILIVVVMFILTIWAILY